jgi:hypothetical protein
MEDRLPDKWSRHCRTSLIRPHPRGASMRHLIFMAVTTPANEVWGGTEMNAVCGPEIRQTDTALDKQFPIRESTALKFRAYLFDVFNHDQLGNHSGRCTASLVRVLLARLQGRTRQTRSEHCRFQLLQQQHRYAAGRNTDRCLSERACAHCRR